MGLEVPDGFVPPDVSAWYTAHDDITHVVDAGPALAAKRASMAAHATQATGAARHRAHPRGLPRAARGDLRHRLLPGVVRPRPDLGLRRAPDELFPGLFTASSPSVP